MIVACVRAGDKYPVEYVTRLRDMVAKHLPLAHHFVCLTDRPNDLNRFLVSSLDISKFGLYSWWAKMALFTVDWRRQQRVLYFDLDTVIVGDLSPLARLDIEFGICANFTRAAGHLHWPCSFGSCAMIIGPSLDGTLFENFWKDRQTIIERAGKYGDQKAIEDLAPDATLLQPLLPKDFFLGYRDLPSWPDAPPKDCSVVVFAGKSKPHNSSNKWVKAAWT